jgi:hypothetical protein
VRIADTGRLLGHERGRELSRVTDNSPVANAIAPRLPVRRIKAIGRRRLQNPTLA